MPGPCPTPDSGCPPTMCFPVTSPSELQLLRWDAATPSFTRLQVRVPGASGEPSECGLLTSTDSSGCPGLHPMPWFPCSSKLPSVHESCVFWACGPGTFVLTTFSSYKFGIWGQETWIWTLVLWSSCVTLTSDLISLCLNFLICSNSDNGHWTHHRVLS